MNLADAATFAVGEIGPVTSGMQSVQAGARSLMNVVTSPAFRVDFRSTARATQEELSLGIMSAIDPRQQIFRATETELALGILRPNDPRRRTFRATPAELRIGRLEDFEFRALFVRNDRGGV
jgi:hypothetical protein